MSARCLTFAIPLSTILWIGIVWGSLRLISLIHVLFN